MALAYLDTAAGGVGAGATDATGGVTAGELNGQFSWILPDGGSGGDQVKLVLPVQCEASAALNWVRLLIN
jgi:hypothetical protein